MRSVGRYQPVGLLAEGGMASVYLAVQKGGAGTQRLSVVKVVRKSLSGDDQYVAMFAEEAELAMRLSHPNVIHAYEVGDHEGARYLAMEYLDGQSLLSCFRRKSRKAMPLELHVHVLVEVLKALDYAHGLKDYNGQPLELVHRDVTPGNVFVTYEGSVKLMDFGIAKTARALNKTEAGVIKGKVTYMAPEQATMTAIGPRTDVFSVGVMLWETLAGRTLVGKQDDPNAVLFRRIERGDPRIREVASDAPEALAEICDRAMARKPEDRYASAAEMQDALEGWLRTRGTSTLQRSLGRFVAEAFAEDRAALAKRIDEAMSRKDEETSSVVQLKEPVVVEASVPTLARTVDPSMPPPARKSRPLGMIGIGISVVLVISGIAVGVRSKSVGHLAMTPALDASAQAIPSLAALEPSSAPVASSVASPLSPLSPLASAVSSTQPAALPVKGHPLHGGAPVVPVAASASAKPARPIRPIDKEDPY